MSDPLPFGWNGTPASEPPVFDDPAFDVDEGADPALEAKLDRLDRWVMDRAQTTGPIRAAMELQQLFILGQIDPALFAPYCRRRQARQNTLATLLQQEGL